MIKISKTRIIETVHQGESEQIAWSVDVANWGGYTSGATCTLTSESNASVTMSGSASVLSTTITSPLVINLKAGVVYYLYFQWVYSGGTYRAALKIIGEN